LKYGTLKGKRRDGRRHRRKSRMTDDPRNAYAASHHAVMRPTGWTGRQHDDAADSKRML
jgi:hypothetical protein